MRFLEDLKQVKTKLNALAYEMQTRMEALEQQAQAQRENMGTLERKLAEQLAREKSRQTEQLLEHIDRQTEVLSRQLNALCSQEQESLRQISFGDYVNPELALLANRRRSADEKQLLVIGFYGGCNMGDELMLETVLKLIRNTTRVHVTLMLAENPTYDAAVHGDVDIIHYCRTYSDFSHLSTCFDGMIVGGGALLDDVHYGESSNHFVSLATTVVELPRYFAAKGKPALMIGLSTNDRISKPEYIHALSSCMESATHFSLRDVFSYNVLKEAGMPMQRVEIIDDLVLAHPCWLEDGIMEASLRREANPPGKRMAITWVNQEQLKSLLVGVLEELAQISRHENVELSIELVPTYGFFDVDRSYLKDVMAELSADATRSVALTDYPMTMVSAIGRFGRLDAAINIRYHASLICAALGIPQTQVVLENHPHYPNKMRGVAQTFGDSVRTADTTWRAEEIARSAWQSMMQGRRRGIDRQRVKDNMARIQRALQ